MWRLRFLRDDIVPLNEVTADLPVAGAEEFALRSQRRSRKRAA